MSDPPCLRHHHRIGAFSGSCNVAGFIRRWGLASFCVRSSRKDVIQGRPSCSLCRCRSTPRPSGESVIVFVPFPSSLSTGVYEPVVAPGMTSNDPAAPVVGPEPLPRQATCEAVVRVADLGCNFISDQRLVQDPRSRDSPLPCSSTLSTKIVRSLVSSASRAIRGDESHFINRVAVRVGWVLDSPGVART